MVSTKGKSLEGLLTEFRRFYPSTDFKNNAYITSEEIFKKAEKDPEGFWATYASELTWYKKWEKVLDWDPPHSKWFVGGEINVCYNCVDRHIKNGRRNKAAIIWEGEPGDTKTLTYWDLYREVNKFANVLKKLGVNKGDRVAIYMPMIPEAVIAMLACARIGAIHMAVFGGFSSEALRDRINDCKAKLLITADGGYRRGSLIPLKHDSDYAVKDTPSIENVLIIKRGEFPLRIKKGKDFWWHELADEVDPYCEPESMNSDDSLFILYTSGTTGKPKGVVHSTGGYLTGAYTTSKLIFDMKDQDVFWCTADIGWITGHSYIVYGPLAVGATLFMYEGAPDWPEMDRYWRIIDKYGITIFYTAPTAIRAFMKAGAELIAPYSLETLRLLGSVGEPINPEAWIWYYTNIGKKRCPIVDTWWQTETGMIMITTLPGYHTMKPGHSGFPFPGVSIDILNESGNPVEPDEGGYLVLKEPWPSMLKGIYGDEEKYLEKYWGKWGGKYYFTGDGARRDSEGYLMLLGRVDDVLSIAGHRIGTMEVESALVSHPSVAEAAVVGITHEITGQAIVAFIVLRDNIDKDFDLEDSIREHVSKKIGPIAKPRKVIFSSELPKTRSGKIMRRLLKDIAEGKVLGDTTTLTEPEVIDNLKKQYEVIES
ncbi:MAG TPA: acetate--CoA ligase [Methanofastidiosum sp.]|nr:acetate--CoA ligase [Methanofastidiosum sp.]HPA49273.1 acetate--CoA ligase [Methanofastidiosum sp.]HQK62683.1 acetate--CoA ligase [Methanofastidiosum sp.]HQQ49027.1 acetate--CoA ligase [Methanofastidiosum sp.]